MKQFTESGEWFEIEGGEATIGISHPLREEIGQIVYLQLPPVGSRVTEQEEAVVLESTKAALDVYAPLTGTVVAINEKVIEDPKIVNESPEGEGWLYKIIIDENRS